MSSRRTNTGSDGDNIPVRTEGDVARRARTDTETDEELRTLGT